MNRRSFLKTIALISGYAGVPSGESKAVVPQASPPVAEHSNRVLRCEMISIWPQVDANGLTGRFVLWIRGEGEPYAVISEKIAENLVWNLCHIMPIIRRQGGYAGATDYMHRAYPRFHFDFIVPRKIVARSLRGPKCEFEFKFDDPSLDNKRWIAMRDFFWEKVILAGPSPTIIMMSESDAYKSEWDFDWREHWLGRIPRGSTCTDATS